jgi:hypothetical protein
MMGKKDLISEQGWYKNSTLALNVVNPMSMNVEIAAKQTLKEEIGQGLKYVSKEVKNLRIAQGIGNVAAKIGGVTAIASGLFSAFKAIRDGNLNGADVLNFVGAGVAVAAIITTAPAVATAGIVVGVAQLLSSPTLEDYKIISND